jgi:hypothetical protein
LPHIVGAARGNRCGERGAVLAFVHVGPFQQTRKARQLR